MVTTAFNYNIFGKTFQTKSHKFSHELKQSVHKLWFIVRQIVFLINIEGFYCKNFFYFNEFSLFFLLSMNEVDIEYWCRYFQKKKLSIFGWIRTFYRKKPDLYEKKNSITLPSARKVWLPTSTLPVQLKDFYFWISEWFGPQSILLIFGLRKQIPSGSSHTNFWLLYHFHVKYWPILMFLGLLLCWAQKRYFMGSEKREIQISRVKKIL
jgi:hypothetical protein